MSKIDRYRQIIENIESLPSLPAVTMRLIQLVNSSDSSAEEAASLIEKDASLTGTIIKMSNSAFYGRPRSVSNVSSAVVVLGFNTIRSIVMGYTMKTSFSSSGNKNCFDKNEFWEHSIACGIAGRIIADKVVPYSLLDGETVFCGAILHDIGKLIFEEYINEEYFKVIAFAKKKEMSLYKVEKEVLGITHAEVGEILSDKWALPSELASAIVYHHNPIGSKESKEISVAVNIADKMANRLFDDFLAENSPLNISEEILEVLSLDNDDINEIYLELEEKKESVSEFISAIN